MLNRLFASFIITVFLTLAAVPIFAADFSSILKNHLNKSVEVFRLLETGPGKITKKKIIEVGTDYVQLRDSTEQGPTVDWYIPFSSIRNVRIVTESGMAKVQVEIP